MAQAKKRVVSEGCAGCGEEHFSDST